MKPSSGSNILIYVRILDLDCVNICGGCFSQYLHILFCVNMSVSQLYIWFCHTLNCVVCSLTSCVYRGLWALLLKQDSWNLIVLSPDHFLMNTHFPPSLLLPFPSAYHITKQNLTLRPPWRKFGWVFCEALGFCQLLLLIKDFFHSHVSTISYYTLHLSISVIYANFPF